MNNTPEERVDKDIWEVMQKIKLKRLQSKYNIPLIKWHVDHNNESENNTISRLEYDDVIKVVKDPIKWITDFEINQINTPNLVKPIHVSDISYFLPSVSSFSNTIFLEILPKFQNIYIKYKTKFAAISNDKILMCRNLKVDIERGIIQYADCDPIEISLEDQSIKFLLMLMKKQKIVQYVEIAKEINMGSYLGSQTANEDVARDVQYKARDLRRFLRDEVNIPSTEIEKMIINKKNLGYKINC